MNNMPIEEKHEIYKRLGEIEGGLSRVLFILESDSRTNTQGLVEEVRFLKERVYELEVDKKIRKNQILIYGALGSAALTALWFLLKQVIIFIFKT